LSARVESPLDEKDADYYDEQIRKFEENSDITDLLKQQVCVIRPLT